MSESRPSILFGNDLYAQLRKYVSLNIDTPLLFIGIS